MKHILTLLLLCCATLVSRADVVPEGAPVNYKMSAQLVGLNGFAPANWIASKVSYSADGKTAYISGFFSLDYPVDQLWVKGLVEAGIGGKGTITIDHNTTALTVKTEGGEDLELKMGEITFDSNDNPVEVNDVVLTKDGDRIYLKDNTSRPSHILGLYYTHDDIIYVRARMHSPDLTPYDGHVNLVELPAAAKVQDYIYHTYKWYGAKEDIIGHVAVAPSADGSADGDYYFDSLLPDVGRAWVKGTRKGNTITLPNDQYLGVSNGFYVYYFGNLVTGVDYENMVNIEEFAEITFSIDNAGKIKLNNQSKANPGAYFPDGNVFGATYNHSLEPYESSDAALEPSAPYDISVGDEFLEEYGGYVLDFLQDNVSVDGEYLEPSKLGYYIYLDDERFTFRRDEYPYIDSEEMTLVPFGYSDIYNYDFNSQANMNEVYIYRTDWSRIGVQAVYTNGGETKTSAIIYVDRPDGGNDNGGGDEGDGGGNGGDEGDDGDEGGYGEYDDLAENDGSLGIHSTYKPVGTPMPYIMNGFYDTPYGMMQIIGFSNTVYFADDGKTVYVGSFLPRDFKTNEFWAKGRIVRPKSGSGQAKIVFDADEVALTLNEDYGTYRFHLCEYYEEDRGWKCKDLELNYDEDGRIYIDDNEANPQRHLGLCMTDLEGNAYPYFEFRCIDLKPFDLSTEFTEIPATATVSEYVYTGNSSFSSTVAQKGRVAVDGDDYYFDSLLPEMGNVWVKGTREGQRITLQNDQYLGNGLGYYLYYNGVERTKYNELYGNWDIMQTDLTMTVGRDGSITVDNGSKAFPGAYTAVGYLYYYVQNMRLAPYNGPVVAAPEPPSEIELYDQYNDYGVFCLVFRLSNLKTDGTFLDPDCLSYRIWLDDEPYTFRKRQYPNIDSDMELVPYGYTDRRGDEYADIVCRDINWNVVNLREDMFERVGVQTVYTVGDETRYSPILYIGLDGRTSTVYPEGIDNAICDDAFPLPVYDLSGRPVRSSVKGIVIEGGKAVLR